MPAIKEYVANRVGLTPSETGVEAFQRAGIREREDYDQAGHAIGGAIAEVGGQQAKVYTDYQTHQDNTNITGAAAAGFAQQLASYNAAAKNTDPNDTTVGQKFMEGPFQNYTQKIRDMATTKESQDYADRLIDSQTEHLTNVIGADRSTRSKLNAANQFNTMVTSWTNTVATDPSALSLAHQHIAEGADAIISGNPSMSAADAAEVKGAYVAKAHKEVDESAFLGVLTKNPTLAGQEATSGVFKYLDGAKAQQAVKVAQHAEIADQRLAHIESMQAAEQISQTIQSNLLQKLTPGPNGTLQVPGDFGSQVQSALGHGLRPAEYENLVRFSTAAADRAAAPKITTDPALYGNLASSVTNGTASMKDITTAYVNRELSDHDYKVLSDASNILAPDFNKDPTAKDAFTQLEDSAKQVFHASGTAFVGPDPASVAAYSKWYADFLPQLLAQPDAAARKQFILNTMGDLQNVTKSYLPDANSAVDSLTYKPPGSTSAPAATATPDRKALLNQILNGSKKD